MNGQHPIETEGDMYLARETIIASDVRRDIEERVLVEGAVGVRSPTVLVAVQDIQAFHRTAAYYSADIRPGFVESPAAICQHAAAAHAHITAVFEDIFAIRSTTRHGTHKTFKARAQMFP